MHLLPENCHFTWSVILINNHQDLNASVCNYIQNTRYLASKVNISSIIIISANAGPFIRITGNQILFQH